MPRKPKKLRPDVRLAEASFDGLNKSFYFSEPTDYFHHRWTTLMLALAKPTELEALLLDGPLEYSGIKLTLKKPPEDEGDEDERKRRDEAVLFAEIVVLFHHTTETLLRLFLAHVGRPGCPWLELARLREHYKAKVRELADPGAPVEDVIDVFFGSAEGASLNPEIPQDFWEKSIHNVSAHLRYLAEWSLEGDFLYNSAKHGFGVGAGVGGLAFGDPPLFDHQGPTVSFLEIHEAEDRNRWHMGSEFLNVELMLTMIRTEIQLIRQLWSIARVRYAEPKPFRIIDFSRPTLDELLHVAYTEAYVPRGFSLSLLYHDENGDPEERRGHVRLSVTAHPRLDQKGDGSVPETPSWGF